MNYGVLSDHSYFVDGQTMKNLSNPTVVDGKNFMNKSLLLANTIIIKYTWRKITVVLTHNNISMYIHVRALVHKIAMCACVHIVVMCTYFAVIYGHLQTLVYHNYKADSSHFVAN